MSIDDDFRRGKVRQEPRREAAPNTIKVKAAPALKVAREERSRRYIDESEPFTVVPTAYYLRRLADGELIEVKE